MRSNNADEPHRLDRLQLYGLQFVGDPPSVSLAIAGTRPAVQVQPIDGGVQLRAELATAGRPPDGRLADAGLATPGDTTFSLEGTRLIGTRTLIEPSLGAMYDAIFELAKATCLLARYVAAFETEPLPADAPTAQHLSRRPTAPPGAPPSPLSSAPPTTPTPPRPAPPTPHGDSAWKATHRVGPQGAAAYAQLGDSQPAAQLDPWLDVEVIEESPSGWAHVMCSNSWSAWIDRRALQPLP